MCSRHERQRRRALCAWLDSGRVCGNEYRRVRSLPATGRSVSLPWVNILRFDSDGRIIGGGAYYDLLTVMTQLGHMQPPAGA